MSKSLPMRTADPLARNVWLPEILKKLHYTPTSFPFTPDVEQALKTN